MMKGDQAETETAVRRVEPEGGEQHHDLLAVAAMSVVL